MSSGYLQAIKNNRKFQTITLKVVVVMLNLAGRVAYQRFQVYLHRFDGGRFAI